MNKRFCCGVLALGFFLSSLHAEDVVSSYLKHRFHADGG